MRVPLFATVFAIVTLCAAAPASARDDGPRFAQDRLDALVAQHAQANRHITSSAPSASAPVAVSDAAKPHAS